MSESRSYAVSGVHCEHCRAAIEAEMTSVTGVTTVVVDLDLKSVTVTGDRLDDAAIRAAINEAGFDVA